MELERIMLNIEDIFDGVEPSKGVKEALEAPETLDQMVRALARHALDLLRRERQEWSRKTLAYQRLVDEARFNESAAKRREIALARAINEHPDAEKINARVDEIMDSAWSHDKLASLPF